MKRPARAMPMPWRVRSGNAGTPRPAAPRPGSPATPFAGMRPGIASRWKPRDRVNAAGN